MPEYGEIERAFLEELEADETESFLRLISILRVSEFFYHDDLDGEADCSEDMVERLVEILLRFKLFYKTSGGYARKTKFNLFINRFMRMHPELKEKICGAKKGNTSV